MAIVSTAPGGRFRNWPAPFGDSPRAVMAGCSGGTGGGGIPIVGASAAQILDNEISGNVTGSDGGGISLSGGDAGYPWQHNRRQYREHGWRNLAFQSV